MLSQPFNCPKCKKGFSIKPPDKVGTFDFGCSNCGKSWDSIVVYCKDCDKYSFSWEDSAPCTGCGRIYTPETCTLKAQPKLGFWETLINMNRKRFPIYAWDASESCSDCLADTIWFVFTKEGKKKYCCLCGEKPYSSSGIK